MKGVNLCILATLFLGSTNALTNHQLLAQVSDKTRVLSLENAWNEAETHNDSKAVAALLAPSFVYTDAQGAFMGKSEFLAGIRAETYHPGQIINENMKAEAYGHVVVVTGAYREEGTEKGKPYVHRGRFTDTWIEDNGQWLCVASQETLIAH